MYESTTGLTVLVTGVTGQDGGYLAERLVEAGHEVHGLVRLADESGEPAGCAPDVITHTADLADTTAVAQVVEKVRPRRIFNLAGSTSVARSWEEPVVAADVMGVGAVRLLKAAWELHESGMRDIRFLQASSAEVFGDPASVPQDESTPRDPVTPYGAAKAFAHTMVEVYRRRGLFASSAILYNHESPRRPAHFVARKISRTVARIALGQEERLVLGNVDVRRDWGYAPDYVDAMMRVVEGPEPGDFVVATGEAHTVRDFVEEAFAVAGVEDWQDRLVVDPALYRPADPAALVGDATRLRALGWQPSVSFKELVRIMVEADLEACRNEMSGT